MTQAVSLSDRINQSVQDFMSSLPDDEQATVQQSFEKLHASSVAADAVNIGDTPPDFSLPNATGRMINLYAALEQGPVVLSFYRGGWCPFCSLELQALQQVLPEIRSLGATLIGVSPETPDNSLTTTEKYGLDFEVVSDVGNRTARDYGLIFTVYEEMRPLYLQWGLDVPACNGDDSWELPVPATYLIGPDRVVHAAHVDRDYTKRMEPEQILEALKELF
jgi:peroxiredoxin